MPSFIFCTSCIRNSSQYHYVNRYQRWINYYLTLLKELDANRLFLIDDGGTDGQKEIPLLQNELPDNLEHPVNLFRFTEGLGRNTDADFPGWWRSFLFSMEIAGKYGYKKIIHIESDFFIVSQKLKTFIREIDHGWTSLYSHFHGFPETAIQVICEDAFPLFHELRDQVRSANYRTTTLAEQLIPFTNINKDFIGDRIGEPNVLAKWMTDHISQFGKLDYLGQINIPQEMEVQQS
jgi:hypothetical protein